ncbi:TPA: DUF4305 domain-containing protein [Streptococcus suis]|nr:DUF4305 domain-containing protein [Streptococcus suis]
MPLQHDLTNRLFPKLGATQVFNFFTILFYILATLCYAIGTKLMGKTN